ncbi:MAG: ABC transporter permease [Pelagibacterales bacterium]|nr:ABC transporter permease [Pelagibacterales bacterium]MDG2268625.1 ABC transporter permease [Alphaproteobacteria bacterium]|tara:strand:+ start:566 stop:1582 length:1017 start_codon:yes stop_codon:yes gene_type:complete
MININQRKILNFKNNKRGLYSLYIFLLLLFFTLPAEFIANDKPLLVKYNTGYYFPVFNNYAETVFGGDFETSADYRDTFVIELIESDGWIIWPLIPFNHQTVNYNLQVPAPSPPSLENILGTDDQARDVLARLIYGFRISILFGILLTFFSSIIGVAFGAIQGYLGGLTDLLGQRFIEIWSGMPILYLLIIVGSIITPNFWILLILLLIFSWMNLVGVVRAEFLRARNFDYVKAAKCLGMSDYKIIVKHLLPNAMVATITYLPFILAASVTTLTSLDFLGFGLPPGSASLGELLNQGKNNLQAPWLGITGFTAISILLSLLVFIGEAIRDAFDPRKIN